MLQHGRRPTIASRHGMVAAAHPLAAAAGARMLAQGGNAFDAAAATAAALNVVEPYMSGLAGTGMATCYIAAEKRVRIARFHGADPAEISGRAASATATSCSAAPLAVGRARQSRRLVRAGARLRPQEAAGDLRAGDRARARRLSADRVQRRGDQRRRAPSSRGHTALYRRLVARPTPTATARWRRASS